MDLKAKRIDFIIVCQNLIGSVFLNSKPISYSFGNMIKPSEFICKYVIESSQTRTQLIKVTNNCHNKGCATFFTWKVLGDGGRINWRLWHSSWGWSEYLGCYPLDTPPGYPQITWVVLATLAFYQFGACDTKIVQFQPNTLSIITIKFFISIYSNLY